MKKYTLLYLCTALALGGCKHTAGNGTADNANADQQEQSAKKENAAKIVRRTIPLGADFNNIMSLSGADIVFSQGDYSMEVEGDSVLMDYIATEVESHMLTVSFASERNKSLSVYDSKLNMTVYVSAPELQCVSICGKGNFTTKGLWIGDKIDMGMIGEGEFHCDSIECNNLQYQATGKGDAYFAHIKAGQVHFANMSGSNVKADVDTESLLCDNVGHSTFSITGKAKSKEVNKGKGGKVLIE